MYAPEAPARLVAIVDWEMSTIGDPLADLGYLTTFWFERDDPSWGLPAGEVTRAEGFFTRDEILARYEERSGRSMSDARWYQVLALWKIIVFMEGNYKRAVAGSTDDPYLRSFGETIVEIGARAEEATRG
jgi:aminoglycoside phosphotransferase (APT) family kinase protein